MRHPQFRDIDYGHDAVMKYCQGIMDEGIFCDLHVWGGCFHGFVGFSWGTDLNAHAWSDIISAFRLMFDNDLRR